MKKNLSLFLVLSLLLSITLSSASRKPVKAKNGMVVSADPLASKAGLEILKKGNVLGR